jgi:hypothetical protein
MAHLTHPDLHRCTVPEIFLLGLGDLKRKKVRFQRQTETVNACVLTETIQMQDGKVLAVPGDWLVHHEHGEYSFWKADRFTNSFESIDSSNPNP